MTGIVRMAMAAALTIAGFVAVDSASSVKAQSYNAMTCGELWYARNKIYADAGFCFKTARAQQEFGRGCFPPYGRLSGLAKQYVDEIQYWESRRGCR